MNEAKNEDIVEEWALELVRESMLRGDVEDLGLRQARFAVRFALSKALMFACCAECHKGGRGILAYTSGEATILLHPSCAGAFTGWTLACAGGSALGPAVEAEREACAKLVEGMNIGAVASLEAAAAIRARGNPTVG